MAGHPTRFVSSQGIRTRGAIASAWLACVGAACCVVAQEQTPPPPPTPPVAEPVSNPATSPATSPAASPTSAPEPARETPAVTSARKNDPQEVEVVRRDRSRLTGVLIERTDEKIVMSISGLRTELPMSEIESVKLLASVEDRYAQLRIAIDPQDVDSLLNLARWLRERERYSLSHREVERVLLAEPNNPIALEMKRQLEAQMKVLGQRGDPEEKPVRPAREEGEVLPPVEREDFPLLSDDQINLMRVFETDLKDPPRMIIKRSTVDAFLDKYAGTVVEGRGMVPVNPEGRKQFLAQSEPTILSWMFDLRAREFYDDVQVMENPRSMRLFRDNVHRTWLMNGCATTRCHGGEEAGRLYLYNRNPASDRSAYTNFFILEKFRTSQGLPLIDYTEPRRSPLLQMGLPRDKAAIKHPDVGGAGRRWNPAFSGEDDPRFRAAVSWIRSMYSNRPEYPIEYVPPVPRPLRGDLEQPTDDGAPAVPTKPR